VFTSIFRYNGYYASPTADPTPVKTKRGSPKKKNTADTVTATPTKAVIKRRSKVKSSVTKAEAVINGVAAAAGNIFFKNKDLPPDKFRASGLNHMNSVKAEGNSYDTINSILSGLSNNVDSSVPNHSRATLLNHARTHAETPTISVTYSKNQYNHSNDFIGVPKVVNQRMNHVSATSPSSNRSKKLTKLDDLKTTEADQPPPPSYLSTATQQFQYRLPSTTNSPLFDGFADRAADCRFAESGGNDATTTAAAAAAKKPLSTESTLNQSCESKLFLRAKRRRYNRRKWQMDNGTRHEALQRIRDCLELQDNFHRDLFPLRKSSRCRGA
jgi:hypothetical protein